MNITKNGIEVKPGQVWRDLDKRCNGRTRKIVRVENGFAHYDTPKKGRIAVARMHNHSTGFALVPTP